MNNRTRSAAAAFLSLVVPAAAAYIWRNDWWPWLLLAVWIAAAAVVQVRAERRYFREQNARMLQHARASSIRTLSHHRHDWMNDLQILYGYLRLKKPDKAAEMVDRIRERMENDSKISQLGSAELSTFLLSFRTVCDTVRLEVQVADGVSLDRLPLDTEKLTQSVIGMINAIRYRALSPSAGENVLRLKLFPAHRSLILELEFEGELAAGGNLAEEMENLLGGLGQLTEKQPGGSTPGAPRRMLVTFPLSA